MNTAYRSMDQSKLPKLSFTERCFVSGSRLKRVIGHTVLITKNILKSEAVALILMVIFSALAIFGVLFGLFFLTRYSTILGIIAGLVVFGVPLWIRIVKEIMKSIEANRKEMMNRITKKFESVEKVEDVQD